MEALRNQANELFRMGKYREAIDKYSEALKAEPNSANAAQVYGNRSFAALKLELYGDALNDSNKAIELDSKYSKAYYRRAAANMALSKPKLALEDLKKVAKMQEQLGSFDKFIDDKIRACEKLIRQLAFERAIAVEGRDEKPIANTIEIETYQVTDKYTGPRLDQDKLVTKQFVNELIVAFQKQEKLHVRYVLEILRQTYNHLAVQPSLIDISIKPGEKFTVVGDIHGQYFDLINIFKNLNGMPSEENPYLFNGDIVDRGSFSTECIILLLSLKLLYPKHFFIARGNHETHSMNQMYGFRGECLEKYSSLIYNFFTQVFQVLPLAYCLAGYDTTGAVKSRVLVMHGGLFSRDDVTLEEIRKIDRNRQPPHEGVMCEILWSDPINELGRAESKRGIAIGFGKDVTEKFCKLNNIDYIIRSHEVKQSGYEVTHDKRCITVFSAPNYCDSMGNNGAVIKLKAPFLKPEFKIFCAVPHPEMKPMAYADQLVNLL